MGAQVVLLPDVNGLAGGNAVQMDAVPPEAQPFTWAPLLELLLELLLLELLELLLLELLELLLLELELELELLELELPPGAAPPQPNRLITGTATMAEPMAFTSVRRPASGVRRSSSSMVFMRSPALHVGVFPPIL